MSFAHPRASWGLNNGVEGEDLLTRVASVGQAAADAIQEAADELEARTLDEQDRVARMTEQLVLERGSRPEDLEHEEARLQSFELVWKGAVTGRKVVFPADRLFPLSPTRLAWAGFYYLPDARVEDRTICFSCGKALHSWEANDDPLYEHCKSSPDCEHVRSLAEDNLEEDVPTTPSTAKEPNPDSPAKAGGASAGDVRIDWRTITDPMPRDSVVDHLILIVHGIGTNDETLPLYLEQVRAGMAPSWQRKYLDIPLSVAVDAISWHGLARAPQEIMQNITLPTVPTVREVINDTMLDVLYYRSPVYGQQLIDVVARLLNEKVALYKKEFPLFSGQVSLYCHSLGSVIMFDLLQNQRPTAPDLPCMPTPVGTAPPPSQKRRASSTEFPEGELLAELAEQWQWPQLNFKVDNMFALGSPVAIMLTTRGDIDEDWWPRNATRFSFPGGARLFNIFDPTDPVAFRFEPLINPKYSQIPAALVPSRSRRTASAPAEEAPKAARADFFGWQRIDYALQEGSDSGLMGHLRAISNAHHCYWVSKDLSVFIVDTLLSQKLYVQDPALEQAALEVESYGPKAPRGTSSEGPGRDWAMEVLSVKEQVMWLLTSDLLAAEVNPIVGSRSGTTGGTVNYALGNLRVSSIDVPRHKVIVVCDKEDRVTVKATDISASLNGFTWLYKQRGPPHLKDSGTADASVGGLSLWLGLSRSQLTEGLAKRRRGSWVTPRDSAREHEEEGRGQEDVGEAAARSPARADASGEEALAASVAAGAEGAESGSEEECRERSGEEDGEGEQLGHGSSGTAGDAERGRAGSGGGEGPRGGGRGGGAERAAEAREGGGGGSGARGEGKGPAEGSANAGLLGSSVASFGSGQGTPDVRIKIRSLDIVLHKSSSAMMSWLYRMLLSAFSETIRSSVEEAVVWTLKERLREA